MVKKLAIDLGGVLFSEGKSVAVERLAEIYGYEQKVVSEILSSPEAVRLRQGLISDDDFWHWVQQQLPAAYDARLIRQEWYDGYVLDPEIYQLVVDLQKNYPIIAFSGNIRSRIDYLEAKYHFRHLFQIEIYSFDYHLTKPQKEFVQVMIDKAGVRCEEIVYIDDNDVYAKPARDLGVNVIIHHRGETESLRHGLKRYGLVF